MQGSISHWDRVREDGECRSVWTGVQPEQDREGPGTACQRTHLYYPQAAGRRAVADTPEQRPGRDYDGWLKLLMQRLVWREAFLELCTDLPPALRRRTFPWPTEWVNHHLGKELADKLLAVEGDGSDLAGLILIEFQSTYDSEMANRIRSYQWNAWNFAAAEGRLTADGSRPWIHALVFHTGPVPWPANPVWIADRVLPGGEVVQELVPLKVVSIHDFSDEETETRNPFLVIVRMLRLVNRLREEPGLEQQAEALAQVGRFSDALDRLLPNDADLRREAAQLQHSFFCTIYGNWASKFRSWTHSRKPP